MDGNSLAIVFNQALDTAAAGTPAATAFSVSVGGDAGANPSAVSISGSTVTLTLATAVKKGQVVTVTYTAPASGGRLRSAAGNRNVATFTGQSVTNNTPRAPGEIDPGNRELVWSATLTVKSIADTTKGCIHIIATDRCSGALTDDDFVRGGTTYQVTTIVYGSDTSGNLSAVLDLNVAIPTDLRFHVGNAHYDVDDATLSDGGKTATWARTASQLATGAQVAVGLTAPQPPTVSSATVDGTALAIVFDQALDTAATGTPAATAFSVNIDGTGKNPSGVSISGSTVTLTLATAVTYDQVVTVSYTLPASGGRLRSADGNRDVATFSDQSVINDDGLPPALTHARVYPGYRTELWIVFDKPLDTSDAGVPAASAFTVTNGKGERWVPSSVSVSGNVVKLGQRNVIGFRPVLVSYTSPGPHRETIREWLVADLSAPRKQRHTARRIWQRLVDERGATVAEPTVRAYVARVRRELESGRAAVTVPQLHPPGAEAEVDFGQVSVWLDGVLTELSMFVMRLSHSGRAVHVCFPSEGQEAFLEGHVLAFERFGGVPGRVRYDNLKAAVARVLAGRRGVESDRFTALRSHFGFDAFFCAPGLEGAHEKGGVEGEVGRFRRRHLVPVPRVESLAELNALLEAADRADDRRHIASRLETVGQMAETERPALRPLPAEAFDPAVPLRAKVDRKAGSRCAARATRWPAEQAGRSVEVRLGGASLTVMAGGRVIARHERSPRKGAELLVLDHYLEVLLRKPGALPGAQRPRPGPRGRPLHGRA